MFSSTYLDVAIGLIFVFLLLSLLVTIINEILAGALKFRAQMLRKGIYYMLSDKNGKAIANKIYNHPLVNNPIDSEITPSYIASKDFANMLIDIFTPADGCGSIAARFENAVKDLPNGEVKNTLMTILKNGEGDINKLRSQIENWFDASMGRVSGWYKRKMQVITFFVGAIICIAFHANTFTIVGHLAHDKDSREKVVQMATDYIDHHSPEIDSMIQWQRNNERNSATTISAQKDTTKKDIIPAASTKELSAKDDSLIERIDSLSRLAYNQINFLSEEGAVLGLGWNYAWDNSYGKHWNNEMCICNILSFIGIFLLNLPGILLTTLALLLGAPFWFDLLNKLINIRNAGKKPDEASDKK